MIQIIDGEITKYSLPKVGTLKDGSTISGYHLLDEETLALEGWLPLEDIPPIYDIETQYLVPSGYEILEDKVIKQYQIKELSELPISRDEQIDAIILAVQKLIRVDDLTPEELEGMINLYPTYESLIGNLVPKNTLLRYRGILYKTLAEITVSADFNPVDTNYQYVKASASEVIPIWVLPTGYENAYDIGTKVIYEPNGKVYISKIEGNSQEPTKDEPHNRYWVEE